MDCVIDCATMVVSYWGLLKWRLGSGTAEQQTGQIRSSWLISVRWSLRTLTCCRAGNISASVLAIWSILAGEWSKFKCSRVTDRSCLPPLRRWCRTGSFSSSTSQSIVSLSAFNCGSCARLKMISSTGSWTETHVARLVNTREQDNCGSRMK